MTHESSVRVPRTLRLTSAECAELDDLHREQQARARAAGLPVEGLTLAAFLRQLVTEAMTRRREAFALVPLTPLVPMPSAPHTRHLEPGEEDAKGLRRQIQTSGLTQGELARRSGVMQQQISDFVRGRSLLDAEKREALSRALEEETHG